jgi:hypothetical protein
MGGAGGTLIARGLWIVVENIEQPPCALDGRRRNLTIAPETSKVIHNHLHLSTETPELSTG